LRRKLFFIGPAHRFLGGNPLCFCCFLCLPFREFPANGFFFGARTLAGRRLFAGGTFGFFAGLLLRDGAALGFFLKAGPSGLGMSPGLGFGVFAGPAFSVRPRDSLRFET